VLKYLRYSLFSKKEAHELTTLGPYILLILFYRIMRKLLNTSH